MKKEFSITTAFDDVEISKILTILQMETGEMKSQKAFLWAYRQATLACYQNPSAIPLVAADIVSKICY